MKKKIFNLLVAIGNILGVNKLVIKLYKSAFDKTIALSQKDRIFGEFTDSFNQKHKLHTEIRDLIKPGWQAMFDVPKSQKTPPKDKIVKKLNEWQNRLITIENYLAAYDLTIKGKNVMEIGAYDGATAYALAKFGANKVIGSDIATYYIIQTPGVEITVEDVQLQNKKLAELRNIFAKEVNSEIANNVSFQEDNICNSSIPSESLDVILSWEVLEHITKPENAFKEMARILKPGGIAFHEYNPFFSIYGGHKEVALSFYNDALNRMTLAQLEQYITNAGLKIVNVMPMIDREHLTHLDSSTIKQIQNLYPSLTLHDLIAPFVWVLFQKP
jgi:2-polyprenyl-3-methyl-5-hydroxy-6-metoxy-1,4-benzoquinol methylase